MRVLNKGHQDAFSIARQNGCEIEEIWDATLDGRTRPSHGLLDGKAKDVEHDGWYVEELGMYVKGPLQSGVASFDINCRCRISCRVKGVEDTDRRIRGEGIQNYKTYNDWIEAKASNGSTGDKHLERKVAEYHMYKMKHMQDRFIKIDADGKLNGYSLNPTHPKGGDKANVFMAAFGYEQGDGALLEAEIRKNIKHAEIITKDKDLYGRRYRAYIPITGKNGHRETIEVGFVVDSINAPKPIFGKARLTTAFLGGKKRK